MQRPADFHDQIADARLPQAARVVDDAAALDAAVDVRDAVLLQEWLVICYNEPDSMGLFAHRPKKVHFGGSTGLAS